MREFQPVTGLLNEAVTTGLIPGFVAVAGVGQDVWYRCHGGQAQVYAGRRPMHEDTLFDVASLTKVMVTLPSALMLVERGYFSIDTPVAAYFPQYAYGAKRKVSIGHLLTHTAGLVVPKPPLWQQFAQRKEIVEAALAQPIGNEPGTVVQYSDVGFVILGELIEQVTGVSLDSWVEGQVFRPLEMYDTRYAPWGVTNVAATEVRDGRATVGLVHDKTAGAMQSVAGHAGLFSTGMDVAHYLMMWAGASKLIDNKLLDQAVLSKTLGTNGNRGWGWVLRGDSHDICGERWPPTAASHTGFTGTSVMFDRPSHTWACLLTNRVHYGRAVNITMLRRRFHTALGHAFFHG